MLKVRIDVELTVPVQRLYHIKSKKVGTVNLLRSEYDHLTRFIQGIFKFNGGYIRLNGRRVKVVSVSSGNVPTMDYLV